MELVPESFPESFINGEMEGGMSEYNRMCEDFYENLEEDAVIPDKSLNRKDIIAISSARVTEKWIDAKLDDRWACFRIPRKNIVIFAPHEIEQDKESLNAFKLNTFKILTSR